MPRQDRNAHPMIATRIPYEDGEHMTQYFANDGNGWYLIGYDGVARDIPATGDTRHAFESLVGRKLLNAQAT